MPLHPQAAKFLKTWNSLKQPPMETQPVSWSRQVTMAGVGLLPGCPEMARVDDRRIPGPGGDDLRIRITTPKEEGPYGVCLYFHGGGWVLNSVDTHDDLVRRLTAAAGCVFISVDYRLAPEHPYPAAVEDGYAVLEWIAENAREFDIDHRRIAVAGDSAGGNIAAALCLMSRDRNGPPIRQQCLAYPITDCDFTRPSYIDNAEGYFLTASQMKWFWNHYCPDLAQRFEPYASPIRGDLSGLPSALVLTAEYDPLRDEGDAYALALQEAGVDTIWQQYPGMIHAFLRRTESFDAAGEAIEDIGRVLRQAFA
ncbi:alpha/beta hydrolase fold domain-containing protein [bacterium]|nr:alpha/beta hydrolase fold domain-containing protein [bacterium]